MVTITHARAASTVGPANPALLGGPDWNANHVITGLAASATTDTTNAANISSGTLPLARLPASGLPITPELYGAVGDGVTDDQTAIVAAIAAAVAQNRTLVFSGKTYAHSATLDFSHSNLRVVFLGQCTLLLTGASMINVQIDAGTSGVLYNIEFGRGNAPFLTGNSTTINNLFVRGLAHGSWVEAVGGNNSTASTGFQIDFAVGTTFRLTYSNNQGFSVTSMPSTAVVFTSRNTGELVTACPIHLVIDGMVNGVSFMGAEECTITGFSENNSGTGTFMASPSNGLCFFNWFSEDNGTHDIYNASANFVTFFTTTISSYGMGNRDLIVSAGVNGTLVIGGQYTSINDAGNNSHYQNVTYLTSATLAASATNINFGQANVSGVTYAPNVIPLNASNISSGNLNLPGSVLSSSTNGVGYATGAGGAITQSTTKSTAVTLNAMCGQITMSGASLASNTTVSFRVNNSKVTATDLVFVNIVGGLATSGSYMAWVEENASGSFIINVRNMTGGSLAETVVLGFAVIKGVTS